MPRIPYPDLSKCPDHIRKMVDANPLNVVRLAANATPEVFEGFYRFGSAFFASSTLSRDHLEIAALRVGCIAEASYEILQHESIAKSIGLTDAQIAAIKSGGQHPAVLKGAQQAVLDFVEEFAVKVRVSDGTLARVRGYLGDQRVVDLMFVTGFYMMMSRILRTADVPMDDKLIDMAKMKELASLANVPS